MTTPLYQIIFDWRCEEMLHLCLCCKKTNTSYHNKLITNFVYKHILIDSMQFKTDGVYLCYCNMQSNVLTIYYAAKISSKWCMLQNVFILKLEIVKISSKWCMLQNVFILKHEIAKISSKWCMLQNVFILKLEI